MLNKYKYFAGCVIFMLGYLCGYGQPRLVFHMDKSFYVTGEVIWFNVFLPPHLNEETLLTVFIYDESGSQQDAFSIYSGNGTNIPGYYRIPYEWNSGYYRFVLVGSEKQSAEPYELLTQSIPIYNDLKEPPPNPPIEVAERVGDPLESLERCDVKLSVLQENIVPGDSVIIQFQVLDEGGQPMQANASVSVVDSELTGPGVARTILPGKTFPGEDFFLYGRPVLKGALFSKDGTPYLTNFLGAFDTETCDFYYDITYDLNYFTLSLPRVYRNVALQFLDFYEEELDIQLLALPSPGPWTGPNLPYSPQVKEYLQRSAQRKKIYKLFKTTEIPLSFQSFEVNKKTLEPDRRFILDDYESFSDLPSLFFEISTPLKFKSLKEGGYEAQMFNPEFGSRTFYAGKPLFIVDKKMTRNDQFIAELDIELIDTLDLFYYFKGLEENFGILGYNGVIQIQTQGKGVSLPPEDPFYAFQQPGLQVPLNTYENSPIDEEHPGLTPQQYWNAEVRTDPNGVGKIGFIQGKDLSTFKVEILVKAQNGTFGFAKSFYQVVPKSSP